MEKMTKGYGSIPHLSISKLTQQADKKITTGQELILTKKARDWKDLIIVTEKLDGANVAINKKDGELHALTRSGYKAGDSQYEHHRLFDRYVYENKQKFEWIPDGYKLCGEWMLLAHGTKYDLTGLSPFAVFDIIDKDRQRILYLDMIKLCAKFNISTVPLIHIGQPIKIDNALKLMGPGKYGNPDKPEGVVYRCEREGKVDFLAKYVRADKEDGKYMKDIIYNKGTEAYQ